MIFAILKGDKGFFNMKNEYYPFSHIICHHFYNQGGCSFCGYHSQKRTVSESPISVDQMIEHFDLFANKFFKNIKRADKLIIAPNGSWFTEIPKRLRHHIYKFINQNYISHLKYESRASLFIPEKARQELKIMYLATTDKNINVLTDKACDELTMALEEICSNHIVSFGLEVAYDTDLNRLNKRCCLDDYIKASRYVHGKGAQVCANILIAPHRIKDPVYKAFITARFGAEEMKAEEFLIMPCGPMKGTPSYDDWIKARWNPVSSTAASEIFRIIREQYPNIKIKYQDSMRIFSKHGRHGKFKRKPGRWSKKEKQKVRAKVRKISENVF